MILPKYKIFFIVIYFLEFGSSTDAENAADEILMKQKLRKDLLSQYDKLVKPVKNKEEQISVGVQIIPISIVEINEKLSTMTLNAWFMRNWTDEYLKWNPADYDGIHYLSFDGDIWYPKLFVMNSRPIIENRPWGRVPAIAFFTGEVYQIPPSTFGTRCISGSFPDSNKIICNISIAESVTRGSEVKLRLIFTDPYLYEKYLFNNNSVWKITNISSKIEDYKSNLNYSRFIYTLELKRRNDFTKYIITGPKIVAILLIMAMFFLPPNSYKKINLGCLSLLLLSFIMLYLSSTVTSPTLLSTTVKSLHVVILTATSALLIEVAILNLPRLCDVFIPPPILIQILSGMLGRIIGICPVQQYKREGVIKLKEELDIQTTHKSLSVEEQCIVIAMTLDRCFFVIYLVIFCIL